MDGDWETLKGMYAEYDELLRQYGYKLSELHEPSGEEEGYILTRGVFLEACGTVVAEVTIVCENGSLLASARIARSAVGNRGWNGGGRSAMPVNARKAMEFARDYLQNARQLLR